MKKKRAKYQRWLKADGLQDITNWAANGCTMAEIAENMGVSRTTLYTWCEKHPELNEAIDNGHTLSVKAIENALFRSAVGDHWEESEITETKTMPDGSVVETVRRTRTKKAPSVSAQIFYLKNRAGYRDNPQELPQDDTTPPDPLSEALKDIAEGLDNASA